MNITKDDSGIIVLIFSYNPLLVAKVKNVPGRKCHPEKKYWSFPNTSGTLEKKLKGFEGEEAHIGTVLRVKNVSTPLVGEGGEGYLEDFRRELLSRKYSYKTVKAYIYFNIDFLNLIHKKPLEITDNDIKEYLVYLSEKKEASIPTLNQAQFYHTSLRGMN